ncbi:hypothetical protein SAMN05660642_04641 [Geodermatophilus siccatus]|uniref:Uncharacterized protein n=1 Tax=Geodermatophilus siccatus TaxID=1137991 RepID=A0A1H0ANT8_9ACTN|nr:hypothetical protein [Geodermatophilus siccatus]SDN35232.1 hypothetical protein SAMN05660642_04641 [Geodermatophilus siccatus]
MTFLSWIILSAIGLALLYALITAAVSGGIRHAKSKERRSKD